MADLPRWIWEVIADLLDEDDAHPNLYSKPAGMNGAFQRYDWCPKVVLEKVPSEVLAAAEVIREYRRQAAGA